MLLKDGLTKALVINTGGNSEQQIFMYKRGIIIIRDPKEQSYLYITNSHISIPERVYTSHMTVLHEVHLIQQKCNMAKNEEIIDLKIIRNVFRPSAT